MKSKNLIVLSMVAAMLLCFTFLSSVMAQENKVDPSTPAVDPSAVPDAPLIAPAPDSNSTSTEDETLYQTTDENQTATDDISAPEAADANLIATNTSETPDNLLAIVVVVVLSIVVAASAAGVVYYRRSESRNRI